MGSRSYNHWSYYVPPHSETAGLREQWNGPLKTEVGRQYSERLEYVLQDFFFLFGPVIHTCATLFIPRTLRSGIQREEVGAFPNNLPIEFLLPVSDRFLLV